MVTNQDDGISSSAESQKDVNAKGHITLADSDFTTVPAISWWNYSFNISPSHYGFCAKRITVKSIRAVSFNPFINNLKKWKYSICNSAVARNPAGL